MVGRVLLRAATIGVLAFIYLPLTLVVIYAFNESGTAAWPPSGFTLHWFGEALNNSGLRAAFLTSVAVALCATLVALLLGTLASIAVARYRFFGHQTISFIVILPLALPGIVTGMALSTTFATGGFPLGFFAIVVGHATFCVVLVYNNVLARLRRVSPAYEEASADLGADSFMTFRRISFPALRTALIAGPPRLRAVVRRGHRHDLHGRRHPDAADLRSSRASGSTTRSRSLNVAGLVAIMLSVIPVYLASRISSDGVLAGGRG